MNMVFSKQENNIYYIRCFTVEVIKVIVVNSGMFAIVKDSQSLMSLQNLLEKGKKRCSKDSVGQAEKAQLAR